MAEGGDFDLQDFLPYLLNQAAEATSRGFQATYRDRYGLTRTQWRVMANLGKFGAMTARDICRISHVEKTKAAPQRAAFFIHNLKWPVHTSNRRSQTSNCNVAIRSG